VVREILKKASVHRQPELVLQVQLGLPLHLGQAICESDPFRPVLQGLGNDHNQGLDPQVRVRGHLLKLLLPRCNSTE
jgi:hypothetical protein